MLKRERTEAARIIKRACKTRTRWSEKKSKESGSRRDENDLWAARAGGMGCDRKRHEGFGKALDVLLASTFLTL